MKMTREKWAAFFAAALVGLLVLIVVARKHVAANGGQEQKRLTIGHFKDEPVEIFSVNLRGKALALGGDRLEPTAGWPQQLEITIKNVSEKSVSHVRLELITLSPADSHESISNSEYTFGSHPDSKESSPSFLKPGETARLVHKATFGKAADPNPAQILIQDVFWENDNQIMWSAGRLLQRVPEKTAPGGYTYKPVLPAGAKYEFPKGHVRAPQLVQARAAPSPVDEFCDAAYERNATKYCSVSASPCTGNCWVPTVALIPAGCNPLLGTGCDTKVTSTAAMCTHSVCSAACYGNYTSRLSQLPCQPYESPIIVDVFGDGFSLTDRAGGVVFDIAGTGPRQVSWTAPNSDDSFLALDRNGNGNIDDGTELFGNNTPQPASWAPNGFLALAEYDKPANGGNGDGIIDTQDSVFSNLRLWQDADHDGVSSSAELHGLSSATVEALELRYHVSRRTDQYGNRFRYRARARGATVSRWAWDVFLLI